MDLSKIFTWIFAGIGAIQGILYFEEWWRNKFPKKGGDFVNAGQTTLTPKNKLKSPSSFFMVVAVVGFTISGCFWMNNIEEKTSSVQKQLYEWNDFYKNRGLQAGVIEAAISRSIPFTNSASKSKSKLSPILNSTIGSANAGTEKYGNGSDMIFVIRVENSGQPTTAWGWNVTVILPDGKKWMPSFCL